jgi:putative transposase
MTGSQLYRGFRYPRGIISHVVWLYFRFSLSFRDIEELMGSRGIVVTYETIRQWTLRFGQQYAAELRRRQPRRGDKWHLDEVVLTIKGKHHYLWRAVDQDGHVLMSWCRAGVTGRRPSDSFASFSRACATRHGF